MFTIAVEGSFSAVHRLVLADGSSEPLHGHDWRVVVRLETAELDKVGMVADFADVRRGLEEITAALNYSDLNQHEWFRGCNPTAEHVARVIFDRMAGHPEWGKLVTSVELAEAPGCVAGYCRP